MLESYVRFVSGKYVADLPITGMAAGTMEAFGAELGQGRLLEEGDTLSVVFGGTIPQQFRNRRQRYNYYYGFPEGPGVDLLTKKIEMTFDTSYGEQMPPGSGPLRKPKVYKVEVVGQLVQNNTENDWRVFMDIDQLRTLMKEYQRSSGQNQRPNQNELQGYQRIMVRVKDIKNVQTVQQAIRDMGYQANSLTDILESMRDTTDSIQAVLGGIGAISLLVAAIGITNTMFMSIMERTKEIAVMKVIGATLPDIRRLFLFEAGMIGFFGGLLGLGISFLLSYLLKHAGVSFLGLPGGPGSTISIIPPWLTLSTMVFITLVGLISGFYPAWRAMRISVLDALRAE